MCLLHKVRSAFLEFLAFGFCYLLIPFHKDWKWQKKRSSKGVILIPGYFNNALVFFYHGRQLKKAGFGPIWAVNIGNPFSKIETFALRLKKKIEKMQRKFQLEEIVLIGHSMGGLVASYYAMHFDKNNLVKQIISLGTPFQGTKVAKIGLGQCAEEMEAGSLFLKQLMQDLDHQNKTRIDQIATSFDQIVIPYTSSLLNKELGNKYVLEDLGHASLLFSNKVNAKIISWLL